MSFRQPCVDDNPASGRATTQRERELHAPALCFGVRTTFVTSHTQKVVASASVDSPLGVVWRMLSVALACEGKHARKSGLGGSNQEGGIMQRRVRIAILFVITCAAFVQVARTSSPHGFPEWQRPTLEYPDTLPPATVRKVMITTLRVADVQIVLEKTELKEVQKRFGGTIVGSGDASTANASLCFCGTDVNGKWALWLDSGEISGLRWIDGFTLQRLGGNAKVDRRCRMIPERKGGIDCPFRFGSDRPKCRCERFWVNQPLNTAAP